MYNKLKNNKMSFKKFIYLIPIFIFLFSSCIPDNVKKEIGKSMKEGEKLFADREFKNAIYNIEMYKLRNGVYPETLKDLEFLTNMDSSIFSSVEYIKLDTVYELNLKFVFPKPSLKGLIMDTVKIHYPERFWKGLGCTKSNTK